LYAATKKFLEGKFLAIPLKLVRSSRVFFDFRLNRGESRDVIICEYARLLIMRSSRIIRYCCLGFLLYAALSIVGGIFLADGTLHLPRRRLTDEQTSQVRKTMQPFAAGFDEASITASDGAVLRAWEIRPRQSNGDAVIVLHGMGDNRLGMTGYAQLLLAHGFTVLLPDARGHGLSGGEVATYGVVEPNDIHQWFDWLEQEDHPRCIFGFGESMGAAQLLQSLATGTNFCAVAAESSFANFREIAYDRMGQPFGFGPWLGRTVLRPVVEVAFLRARWKYGLDMELVSPENAASATAVPILLIHGQVDSNIPVRHSRRIHVRNPRTQLWEVPGADHCGALGAEPEEFERRVTGWFARTTAGLKASAWRMLSRSAEALRPRRRDARERFFCISCARVVDNMAA
jgi:uncharacterized protein